MAPADRQQPARGSGARGGGGRASGGQGARGSATSQGARGRPAGQGARGSAASQGARGATSKDGRVVSAHAFQAPGAAAARAKPGAGARPASGTKGARPVPRGSQQKARPTTSRPRQGAAAAQGRARGGAARGSAAQRPPARQFPVLPVVVLAVLVGLGTTLGYGIGRGVTWVRDAWPDSVPPLLADKVAVPEPATVGGPSTDCPASSLTLVAAPDATRVEVGQSVSFDVSITNSGRRPCLADGGNASRQLIITDADGETVWTSAHCGDKPRDLLFSPGYVDHTTLRWSGNRSAEGACTTGQPAVDPGTYTAQVVMAGIPDAVSKPVTITVTAPPEPTPSPDPTVSPDPTPSPDPSAAADAATETPG